jgi:hypothetical protein
MRPVARRPALWRAEDAETWTIIRGQLGPPHRRRDVRTAQKGNAEFVGWF